MNRFLFWDLSSPPEGDERVKLLNLIEEEKERYNAFIFINREGEGIPLPIKDNIAVKGIPLTCGSRMLKDYIAPYNATVVEKALSRGFWIMGKTNMDEFAMGSSTETSFFGPARNPYDISRVPGGSSGGSGVAVALGYAPVALGSDTGGSVRQPAAFCGVFGFRPTYGRISRFGLVSFASSLDTIGLFAWNVPDLAEVLEIIEGVDEKDPTSEEMSPTEPGDLRLNPKEIRIGLIKEHLEIASGELRETTIKTAEALKEEGAEVKEVSIEGAKYALSVYSILSSSEVSSNLSRYFGCIYGYRPSSYSTWEEMMKRSRSEGFGEEVKRRIITGTFVLSHENFEDYYARALLARKRVQEEVEEIFEEVEVLLGPATPTLPFKIGAVLDPVEMYHSDFTTVLGSIANLPSGVAPIHLVKGLPAAVQFHAKRGSDQLVLQMMAWAERKFKFVRVHNVRGVEL